MKKQFFMLLGVLVSPAFAEIAPVYYTDDYSIEYSDGEELAVAETESVGAPVKVMRQPSATVSRNTTSRSAASRASSNDSGRTSGRASSADGRVVQSRAGLVPTSSGSRATESRRTTRGTSGTTVVGRAATETVAPRVVTVSGTSTELPDATTPLYNPSRISVRGNVASVSGTNLTPSTRIGSRVPAIRVASASSISSVDTAASTANALATMDSLAEMTDYCKSQYAACMDNYCNVLDDNQGRCSCSSNIKNYAKAETALKSATEELQEVAQRIQYIGLTTREIETLFGETEAELAMQSKTDNSQIKTSLDKIKNMLVTVRTGTASSDTTSSSIGFDLNGLLDFTIDSTGFDLSSLFGSYGSTTNSVTNQRGEELYKSAVNRCKTAVLKNCTEQGVDTNLITNSYDLQIDKECVLYERSLSDANDQMTATVRNAKNVLQKARLLVAQQKNAYDLRGCINALDSCMQDEFVCGTDYENCLDPTGRYIVNGSIVLGSQPGHPIDPENQNYTTSPLQSDVCEVNLYRTWDMPNQQCSRVTTTGANANNAWGPGQNDTLIEYINQSVKKGEAAKPSVNMARFLLNKIGYVSGDRSYGLCISVLNKCQDYTYTGTGTRATYNEENDVIKQYLSRALIQIKAKQDEVLSSYADGCISDVKSCLSQNGYPDNATDLQKEANEIKVNMALNACRPTIVTCMSAVGYSMGDVSPEVLHRWVCGIQFQQSVCDSLPDFSQQDADEGRI